jgi:hypothetical protein
VTPLLALLLAAAPQTPAAPPIPQRFSILVDPCARASDAGKDVVVCGKGPTPRLPLPDERGSPDHPIPSNPDMTGAGALAAEGTPCAALQGGCTVGFGGPLVDAAVRGLVTAVSDGVKDRQTRAARRRDAGRRVPIPLDDAPNGSTGL